MRVGIWGKKKKRRKKYISVQQCRYLSLRTAQEHGSASLAYNCLSASDIPLKGVGTGAMQRGQAVRMVYCSWPDDLSGLYSQNDNSLLLLMTV